MGRNGFDIEKDLVPSEFGDLNNLELSIGQVSYLLGIPGYSVMRAVDEGKLNSFKSGRDNKFHLGDILEKRGEGARDILLVGKPSEDIVSILGILGDRVEQVIYEDGSSVLVIAIDLLDKLSSGSYSTIILCNDVAKGAMKNELVRMLESKIVDTKLIVLGEANIETLFGL